MDKQMCDPIDFTISVPGPLTELQKSHIVTVLRSCVSNQEWGGLIVQPERRGARGRGDATDDELVRVSQSTQLPGEHPIVEFKIKAQFKQYTPEEVEKKFKCAVPENIDPKFATAMHVVYRWLRCSPDDFCLSALPTLSFDKSSFGIDCIPQHTSYFANAEKQPHSQFFTLGNMPDLCSFYSKLLLNEANKGPPQSHPRTLREMRVDFDHMQQEINLDFAINAPAYGDQTESSSVLIYRIPIPYGNIVTIATDLKYRLPKRSPDRLAALCFRLKCPPTILQMSPNRLHVNRIDNLSKFYAMFDQNRLYNCWKRVTEFDCLTEHIGEKIMNSRWLNIVMQVYSSNRVVPGEIATVYGLMELLARLNSICRAPLYFTQITTPVKWMQDHNIYHVLNFPEGATELKYLQDNEAPDDPLLFAVNYALKCLKCNGYPFLDLVTQEFQDLLMKNFRTNKECTEQALIQLCALFQDCRPVFDLAASFDELFDACLSSELSTRTDIMENCMKVRRVYVTPTRLHFVPPEQMMGNRILRQFGSERMLRVQIKEDDLDERLFFNSDPDGSKGLKQIAEQQIRPLITDGLVNLCGRQYEFLAWSNSQLREFGFYLVSVDKKSEFPYAADMRAWMGEFHDTNPAKYMSRVGQCFTQSLPVCRIPQSSKDVMWAVEPDVEKHFVDEEGIRYTFCFSDGIGRVSMMLSSLIAAKLGIHYIPSAFQIRYGGYKGMVTMDPTIPKTGPHIIFRDSMSKFNSGETGDGLEIVKYSMPAVDRIGRPMIMIIDMVAEANGPETHKRVAKGLHELLENQLFKLSDMLVDEKLSAEALANSIPLKIDFHHFDSVIKLTSEPFFRSLLLAIHLRHMTDLQQQKIEIPADKGRTMYGVMDDTGLLQEDQVFVQFSKDASRRTVCKQRRNALEQGLDPAGMEEQQRTEEDVDPPVTRIVKGYVMVTKNPCISAGDVRILQAVDIPELHHLVDVIAFPKNGPRPLPDQMAGSDLDGDEYSVLWYPEIMFSENCLPQKPEPSLRSKDVVDEERGMTVDQMAEVFINYISNDELGQISAQHLDYIDAEGLVKEYHLTPAQRKKQERRKANDPNAPEGFRNGSRKLLEDGSLDEQVQMNLFSEKNTEHKLSRFHSIAVDFPKSGVCRENLRQNYFDRINELKDTDEEAKELYNRNENPWERPKKKTNMVPDYKAPHVRLNNTNKGVYRSRRIVGQMHRKTVAVEDILIMGASRDHVKAVKPDPVYAKMCPGYRDYLSLAKKARNRYNSQLWQLMTHYGVDDEGQLLSGNPVDLRDKKSNERERQEYSHYSLLRMLEMKIEQLWKRTRAQFFTEFTSSELKDLEKAEMRSERLTDPRLRAKAAAWYIVTYDKDHYSAARPQRFLSFPWIVWDILLDIKELNAFNAMQQDDLFSGKAIDPVFIDLDRELREAYDKPSVVSANFHSAHLRECYAKDAVVGGDLGSLFWLLSRWLRAERVANAKTENVASKQCETVLLLFLHYAVVVLRSHVIVSPLNPFEQPPVDLNVDSGVPLVSTPSRLLLSFLRYVARNEFRASVKEGTLFETEQLGDWLAASIEDCSDVFHRLHRAAFRAYHTVALTGHLYGMHIYEQDEYSKGPVAENRQPFVLRTPWINDWDSRKRLELILDNSDMYQKKLRDWSGCTDIRFHQYSFDLMSSDSINHGKPLYVIYRGTREARKRLCDILSYEPPRPEGAQGGETTWSWLDVLEAQEVPDLENVDYF